MLPFALGDSLLFMFYTKTSQWKVSDQNGYLNVCFKIISFMKCIRKHANSANLLMHGNNRDDLHETEG